MRATWLLVLPTACESGPTTEASAPAPAQVEPAPAEPKAPTECESLARLLVGKCSRLDPDVERCFLDEEIFGDHGKGRTLHYGTGELWFVAPDGYVFTDNDAAQERCPDLPRIRDYDRSRARKSAEKARENDPTACSLADLRVADIIADHLEVNLYGPARSVDIKVTPEHVENMGRDAIERAAEETGMKRGAVEAIVDKVRKVCPKAM